jgi:hypothetical protein
LRGWDLNPRPSGYEPDELPGCSTPRFIGTLNWLCFGNAQLKSSVFFEGLGLDRAKSSP